MTVKESETLTVLLPKDQSQRALIIKQPTMYGRQIRLLSPLNSLVNIKLLTSIWTNYIRHISATESYLKTDSCIISC